MPPVLLLALSQTVSVPCTWRGDSIELRNTTDQPLTFLVGDAGAPQPPQADGAVEPRFECGLDYVHDDFHATAKTLEARATLRLKLPYASEKARACTYVTRAPAAGVDGGARMPRGRAPR